MYFARLSAAGPLSVCHMKSDLDNLQENDLEQLRKLEQFVRQVQNILKTHRRLQLWVFLVFLVGFLCIGYLNVTTSPYRYSAEVTLYYYPKETKNIKKYDDVYLQQIFSRHAVRQKFYAEMNGKVVEGNGDEGGEGGGGGGVQAGSGTRNKIGINYERKRSGRFQIELHAPTAEEAVERINQFADLCVKEYAEERKADLQRWKDVMLQNRADIHKNIQDLRQERKDFIGPLSSVAPEKDYNDLKMLLGDQQATRSKMNMQVSNLRGRVQRLQESLKRYKPGLLANRQAIRDSAAALKKLDDDLMAARELYTDANPRVQSLLAKRQLLKEKFDTMLNECGIRAEDIPGLDNAEANERELEMAKTELEAKQEDLLILDNEIAANTERLRTFGDIIPKLDQLNRQEASFQTSLQKVDESLSDVNYMMLTAKDDLLIGEYAAGARGESPFDRKHLLLAFFAAAGLTFVIALVSVILEFFVGKVTDETELELFHEYHYLGGLPAADRAVKGAGGKQLVLNAICHQFQAAEPEHHVMFLGALVGGQMDPALYKAFEWHYAMAGKKVLSIQLKEADKVADSELVENDDTGLVSYSGTQGILPAADSRSLAPSEVMLLKRDLEALRKKYELIFIRHDTLGPADRLLLEQLAPLCDGALIAVGAHRTPRKNLRALLDFHKKTKLPLMTILSGASPECVTKTMNLEVEA